LLDARSAIRAALNERQAPPSVTSVGPSTDHTPPEWRASGDPPWAGGTVIEDQRRVVLDVEPERVWKAVSRIGGSTGWYFANWLWRLRGALDRVAGGVGFRRGRRDPSTLAVGDPVDSWRVVRVTPKTDVVLTAEMKLPGSAWLHFRIRALGGGRTELLQTARFLPRGLAGTLYWYALWPVHWVVFSGMIRGIAAAAHSANGDGV
jgi:hypothetical protein